MAPDKRDECGCHRDCSIEPHACERPCTWPDCLTETEHAELAAEVERYPLPSAAQQYRRGEITLRQWIDWVTHLAEPVILCPWCYDWEEVSYVTIVDGRFWCCTMCELAFRGPEES